MTFMTAVATFNVNARKFNGNEIGILGFLQILAVSILDVIPSLPPWAGCWTRRPFSFYDSRSISRMKALITGYNLSWRLRIARRAPEIHTNIDQI